MNYSTRHHNIFTVRIPVVILLVSILAVAKHSYGQPSSRQNNSIALDTTNTVRQDSAPQVTPYSPVADSLAKAEKKADSLEAPKKQGVPVKPGLSEDSASRFLSHPWFSIGVGWDLGSFPVLTEWQNALPDSAGDILPLNPDTLGYKTKEPVNTYNILFPIYLSYTPFAYSGSSVAFEGSFFFINKSLQATLQHDTLPARIDYKQSMNCYGFSLGVFYRTRISERYFRIEKVDRTSFILGLSVLPYVGLTRSESITSTGISDSVLSAVNAGLHNLHAWGMGGAWRIGVCSQQTLSAASGMEISLSYVGRYMGMFRENGSSILNKDINRSSDNPSDKLSSLSNTVEIRLEFLIGRKGRS
jgi:hypothetical protein